MSDDNKELDDDLEDEIEFDDDEADEPEDDAPDLEKEEEKDNSASELATLRRERDEAKEERERIVQERDDAVYEAKNANYQAASAYITRCNADVKAAKDVLDTLEGDLEEARINGDAEKAKTLTKQINDKKSLIGDINGQITKYSPLLVKPEKGAVPTKSTETKREVENPILKMARDWESENSWYNNPKYADKREYIEALAKKRAATYDASKIGFWSYIDREAEAYDNKDKKEPEKRRTPPAVRPVSSSGVSKQMTSKTKVDEAIKKETYAMLERHGIDKNNPQYAEKRKSYYQTIKSFKKDSANG